MHTVNPKKTKIKPCTAEMHKPTPSILITIQPPSQIPRPLHKLLVLMLLHLQLPLPLDADRPHAYPVLFLPRLDSAAELGRVAAFDFRNEGAGVGGVYYLAVLVGRLDHRHDSCVYAVCFLRRSGFGARGEGLGCVLGDRGGRWVERPVFS